ncbi:MAG: hypothetical protein RL150_657 [Candidatus Parcubacteria bacterium]
MLTAGEQKTLRILLPLWIILCVLGAIWIALRAPEAAYAPTDTSVTEEGETAATSEEETPSYIEKPSFSMFIEITGGCGPGYDAYCTAAYTAPHQTASVITQLREGVVLQITDATTTESGVWYKVVFNEWLRYPERVTTEWYVPHSELTRVFLDEPTHELSDETPKPEHKRIVVDRSDQKLYAYEHDELVMTQTISTGILATPTPRGTFTIYKKTPSRYMQGPIPGISTKYYDLPGVPWNLYFTKEGGVIHGAYWHNQFGTPWSNGCVNVPRGPSEELYHWADVGTTVFVRD